MKHKFLICAALVLLAILAAVIFDRAWLEGKASLLEAEAYFEETMPPVPAQTPVPAVEEIQAAAVVDDGDGAEYIFTAAATAPEEAAPEIHVAHAMRLTAYCSCEICCGYWATVRPADEHGNRIVYTSTGARAIQGETVAVDPEFIPHGSYVYVQDPLTGAWREYRATDTSPETAHVDIYFDDHTAAQQSGYGGYGTIYWTSEPVDMETLA